MLGTNTRRIVVAACVAMCAAGLSLPANVRAQDAAPPVQPGALSPENLAKKRPKPPFDLTGTWFVKLGGGYTFTFGPPYPKFKPDAQAAYDTAQRFRKENKPYRDDIGLCYPAGLPMIMTRVWPIAMIQLPTAIYMVTGFNNNFRVIYLDGRKHTDPDLVVRSYNGDSIGTWEGDTLVVDNRSFETERHWIDSGLPVSEQLRIIERIRLVEGGKELEIKYIMTDPVNWEGEWTSTKRWRRVDDQDITEVECLPNLNEHLPSTRGLNEQR